MNESTTFSWTCYYHLHHLCFMSQPGVVLAVPAISKQYSREIYRLQTVLSVKSPEGLTIGLHRTGTLLTYTQLVVRQDPRSFFAKLFPTQLDPEYTWGYSAPEAGLCACPYPILSPSIQDRLFGAITICHKPHCDGAKLHPTFVLVVPTLRSFSAHKRSITR